MALPHPRRRALVEHAEDLKTRRPEGFPGQKPLVAIGIGRDADDDVERFRAAGRQGGTGAQLPAQSGKEAGGELDHRRLAAGQVEPRGWPGRFQQSLE